MLKRPDPLEEEAEGLPTEVILTNVIWHAVRDAGLVFSVGDLGVACGNVLLRATLARAAQNPQDLAGMRQMLEDLATAAGED